MARVRIDISSSEPMFLYHKWVEYPLQVRAEFLDELEFSVFFTSVFTVRSRRLRYRLVQHLL